MLIWLSVLLVAAVLGVASSPRQSLAGADTWTSLGPEGGSIMHLLVDPSDPATLYAGSATGGIFKSTDGAVSWRAVNQELRDSGIRAMAMDPMNPATLYAGTQGGSVYKSTDGGENWTALSLDRRGWSVESLAVHPSDPNVVFTGTTGTLLKSIDGGATWSESGAGLPTDSTGRVDAHVGALVFDASSPDTIYAGTARAGVFKSTDGGASWTSASNSLVSALPSRRAALVASLAIDASDPAILYAGSPFDGVFRSLDGAASWSPVNNGLPRSIAGTVSVGRLMFDERTSTLYATSGEQVFKTTDRGQTWLPLSVAWSGSPAASLAVHASEPSRLYLGTGGRGVFATEDGGTTWHIASTGIVNTYISTLLVDPSMPTTIYAGVHGGGIFRSEDAGASWTLLDLSIGSGGPLPFLASGANIRALIADPSRPGTLYAGTVDSGVYKSADYGSTWSSASIGLPRSPLGFNPRAPSTHITALVLDPLTPTTVYAGSLHGGVLKSDDGGQRWIAVNQGLRTPTGTPVTALAIDPAKPSKLYAGTQGGGVFRTSDGGGTWEAANAGLGAQWIVALLVDPFEPATVYAGVLTRGVFKSTDGGTTWSQSSNGLNLYVERLTADPSVPGVLYAGTLHGVYLSSDSAASWSALGAGLDDAPISALAIAPQEPATIYAGTRAFGAFKLGAESGGVQDARPALPAADD
jgi:photosystem II stability/assembly factor-like uncharacterized protein